jgi:LacI family transcriptional regulator
MISLKKIGGICGLAESTVSKALKNDPRIKEETRLRVQEIARKYNY